MEDVQANEGEINHDLNGMKVVLSAPASLASVALGEDHTSLASRAKCFILVREQINDSGFGFHITVNVDRATPNAQGGPTGRRMSTSFRHILVQKENVIELVKKWKAQGYTEKTGGDASGPAGRRNAQFFDGRAVDAEMRAWIDTGVPPSRGSMLRFIIWRLELSDGHDGGLKLSDSEGMEHVPLRKNSFTVSQKQEKMLAMSSRRGSTATSYRPPSVESSNANTPEGANRTLDAAPELLKLVKEPPEILEDEVVTHKPFQKPSKANTKAEEKEEKKEGEAEMEEAKPVNMKPFSYKKSANRSPSHPPVASKKLVGKFPPRRNSVSVIPKSIVEQTGGAAFVAGGPVLKSASNTPRDTSPVFVAAAPPAASAVVASPEPGPPPTPANTPAVAAGGGKGSKGHRRQATKVHEEDAVDLEEAFKRKNFGVGPSEDLRREARITDAGQTASDIAKLREKHGEGPCRHANRDNDTRRDAHKVHHNEAAELEEDLLRKNFGQGPVEEPSRRDARITDAGRTKLDIEKLTEKLGKVPLGPQEEEARDKDTRRGGERVHHDDAVDLEELLHHKNYGVGPQDVPTRRDARITDAGKTAAEIKILKEKVGPQEGPQETPQRDLEIRRDGERMKQDDAKELEKLIKSENYGSGPQDEAVRRDARLTDAGKTAEEARLLAQKYGDGPEEARQRGIDIRRDAELVSQEDAVEVEAELLKANVGKGPQDVALRKDARITDAGLTAAKVQQLKLKHGEGPAEEKSRTLEERRGGELVPDEDAVEMEALFLKKNYGSGPKDDGVRREARRTDLGKTREAISKLGVGDGPQEEAQRGANLRRGGLEENETRLGVAMDHIQHGEGPKQGASRRDARTTDFNGTRSIIDKLVEADEEGLLSGPKDVPLRKEALSSMNFEDRDALLGWEGTPTGDNGRNDGVKDARKRASPELTVNTARNPALMRLGLTGDGSDSPLTPNTTSALAFFGVDDEEGKRRRSKVMGLPVKEVVEIKGTPERKKIKKASPMTPNTTSTLAFFGAGTPQSKGEVVKRKEDAEARIAERGNQSRSPSPPEAEVESERGINGSHVIFNDVPKAFPKGKAGAGAGEVKFSPKPEPTFHVPPEESALPEEVELDKFLDNGWLDNSDIEVRAIDPHFDPSATIANSKAMRPDTAPAGMIKLPKSFDFGTHREEDFAFAGTSGSGGVGGVGSGNVGARLRGGAGSPNSTLNIKSMGQTTGGGALEEMRKAALPRDILTRQKNIKKQRDARTFRAVSNPFRFPGPPNPTGVSFGPAWTSPTAPSKKKSSRNASKWSYDRHGRRHRSKKLPQPSPGSDTDGLGLSPEIYLQNGMDVLTWSGAHLKTSPYLRLVPWEGTGISSLDFPEALSLLGIKNLPSKSTTALFEHLSCGRSTLPISSVLYALIDLKKFRTRIVKSLIGTRSLDFVMRKFKPYDLRETDKVESIVSQRHVKIVLEELELEVEDWEVKGLCYKVNDGRKIGKTEIVKVEKLVELLRGMSRKGEGGGEGFEREEVSKEEVKAIAENPERYLKEMDRLQKKMNRMIEKEIGLPGI
ncbi:hypothetical protein TrST_g12248 [Triparma strigata]|uniref:Uncharacterized protein n=1 Tax=Triparma strigata TaxID=1606541 RepID=A0A9W7BF95_9STRA|nr:hypothetical protein TrST_g12248 [Triparma strigata]